VVEVLSECSQQFAQIFNALVLFFFMALHNFQFQGLSSHAPVWKGVMF